MNWYSLYVDGQERATDVTLNATLVKAGRFIDARRDLRITYGTARQTIRAWRYDYDKHDWLAEDEG